MSNTELIIFETLWWFYFGVFFGSIVTHILHRRRGTGTPVPSNSSYENN